MQCPWAYACSSCLAQAVDPPPDLPPEMDPLASSFAAAQARRDALVGFIKEAAQHGNLKIPGGHVGFVGQHRAEVPPFQAAEAVVDAWKDTQLCAWDDSVQSSVVSLLAALKLGKGNIDSLAKSMYGPRGLSACDDWAAKRQALLSACTIDTVVPELKVVTDGMMSAYRGGASSPEQDSAPA